MITSESSRNERGEKMGERNLEIKENGGADIFGKLRKLESRVILENPGIWRVEETSELRRSSS